MKHLKSLRGFIEALDAIGHVQPIDVKVDRNLEIGAVIRRSYEVRAPAPLFNKIKGVDDGLRVFGALGGLGADTRTRFARVALALGYPADRPGRRGQKRT
jgi:4-hydroxy-3-polyprenylbenzoate decarboxylase